MTTAEVVGHEKELGAYYQQVLALAQEHELPMSAIRQYFWLRLWIWNLEAEAYLSFPRYDTLSEIDPVLDAFQSNRNGTLWRDADQGWRMEIVTDDHDHFFYFHQFRDTMEGSGTMLLKKEREALQAKAKALQERVHRQIELLTKVIGID